MKDPTISSYHALAICLKLQILFLLFIKSVTNHCLHMIKYDSSVNSIEGCLVFWLSRRIGAFSSLQLPSIGPHVLCSIEGSLF
jgi:hypothetical protein